MTANELYHKWMKQWGSYIGEYEEEVVKDIEDFCTERTLLLEGVLSSYKAFKDGIEKLF
jgi:hypothetical protein